jgi:hypothetical protein
VGSGDDYFSIRDDFHLRFSKQQNRCLFFIKSRVRFEEGAVYVGEEEEETGGIDGKMT